MKTLSAEEFFSRAWLEYVKATPDAKTIHDLLEREGEKIVNDHVALRTFDLPGISRLELGRGFEDWGYQLVKEELEFPEKKLRANYYLPPHPDLPKIFISELLLDLCSKELRDWVKGFCADLQSKAAKLGPELFLSPQWDPVAFSDYHNLYTESEYAAWTAAFGIRVNHFTVFVNRLKSFKGLPELNTFLSKHGMILNSAGGVVKGTPEELLEQSSTMAKKVPVTFAGGQISEVLGCYYEFAKRYPVPGSTELFQGFIPKSADKIFESTFEKKN